MKYTDDRGTIEDIHYGIQFITSKKDSERANHWHKNSGHRAILTKGSMEYFERPGGSQERPTRVVFNAPAVFDTQANQEHCMYFTEDSDFVCIRIGGSETQDRYEDDLVRLGYSLKEEYDGWEDGRYELGTQ